MLSFFLALALIPACWKNRVALALWWGVIPVTLISISGFVIFVFKRYGTIPTLRALGIALVPFAVSVSCDFLYIVFTRWILRRVSSIDRIPEIALMIGGNLVIVAVLLVGTVYFGVVVFKYVPNVGAFITVSVLLNSLDVLAGCAFLILALLLLLHRLFWPVIQRPLYAIQRFTPIKNKKWLFGVGLTLLLLPEHLTINVLEALLKRVAGL